MTLDQLRTFLAILESGGFSRAASALGVGQSTVSFHVRELERGLGVSLLDRRAGRVKPTATGRILKRYAVRLIALHDEALSRLRSEEAGETGRVTLAASTIPAEYLLPPLLGEFRRDHPGVSISVDVSDSRKAITQLLAEECDLAIVGSRVRDPRIVSTAFASDQIVLVGRPPSRGRSPRPVTDLDRATIIMREEGSGTREAVLAVFGSKGGTGAGPEAWIQVGSSEAAKRCALQGVGLAFVSRLAVEEDLAAGRLVLHRAPGLPIRRRFHVTRLGRVTLSAAARAFLAVIIRKNR